MKAHISLILSTICIFAASCSSPKGNVPQDLVEVESSSLSNPLGFCPDTLDRVDGKVRRGQFFSTMMEDLGMGTADAYNLAEACDSVFDVRSLRVGNEYEAYYHSDSTGRRELHYLVYERDRGSRLVFSCRPPFGAWVYVKPVEVKAKYVDVTINSSLWNDMMDAGASPLLTLSLSDIYA